MNTLFSPDPAFPEGFSYLDDFINREEEQILFEAISKTELHPLIFQGYEAKRKVASYGYDWNFQKRILSKGREIPREFDFLLQKLADHVSISKKDIAELLVTEYPVGSVINWHRDAPPFDTIAGISIASDCTFKLRPYEKAKQNRKAILSFAVKQRSLYVMRGDVRSNWEHSIAAVKHLRYSITLRTLQK